MSFAISLTTNFFYKHGKSGNAHVINYGGDALEKPNNEGYSSIFG